VDEVRISLAGDGFYAAARRERTTRHQRVDEGFLGILEEDYAIPRYALHNAFMGVPAEPKRSAIALCEWASRQDEPDRALLAWARKNGRGTFRPDLEVVAGDEGEA
jgi:hypothetical protein